MKEDKKGENNEEKKSAWREELEKRQRIERKKEMQRPDKDLAKGAGRALDKSQFTRNRRSTQGGGSTIEILVAFVVITLALTAVMMVIFGNQSFAIDTKVTQRALYHAERGVEIAFASSTGNFSALATSFFSLPLMGGEDDIYETEGNQAEGKVRIVPISECVKRVESFVDWQYETGNSPRSAGLSSIFVSTTTSAAMGGDCDTVGPSGSWESPDNFDITDPIDSGAKGTAVDVKTIDGNTYAFLTSVHSNTSTHDFWIIDVTDPNNPSVVKSIDTQGCIKGSGPNICGLMDVDVFGDYAYVANASSTNSVSSDELLAIDISNVHSPNIVKNVTLGTVPTCPNFCPGGGRVVYAFDNRVYIGTHRMVGTNDEFFVFDISSNPADPTLLGSIEIDHNVNDIMVVDNYAYLATSDDEGELIVVDVSDPSDMSGFNSMRFNATGEHDGQSVFVLNNQTYLGRDRAESDHDFWVLDTSNPSSISSLGSKDLDINPNTKVVGIEVRDNLAFVASTDSNPSNGGGPFMVWNISDPSSISLVSTCGINYSEKASGLDFHENLGYLANESNDALQIIYPSLTCS